MRLWLPLHHPWSQHLSSLCVWAGAGLQLKAQRAEREDVSIFIRTRRFEHHLPGCVPLTCAHLPENPPVQLAAAYGQRYMLVRKKKKYTSVPWEMRLEESKMR